MKKIVRALACALLLAPWSASYGGNGDGAGSIAVKGAKEKEYPKLAKISLVEAVEAANATVAGKAVEADLDDEGGFLVYEVKVIAEDGTTHKVTVDAGDKKILKHKS